MRAEPRDRLDDFDDAVAARRDGLQHQGPPFAARVGVKREVSFHCRHEPIGPVAVRLVHDEDVRDLHDARLERLHLVARAGDERDDRHVRGANDVHFVLPDADRLDDDDVRPRRVEHERRVTRRARETAEVPARRHAADEHALVRGVRLHAHPVAQDGPAGERAGGIHRDHPH